MIFKVKHEASKNFFLVAIYSAQHTDPHAPYLGDAVQIQPLAVHGWKIPKNSGDVQPHLEAEGQAVERVYKVFYKPRS